MRNQRVACPPARALALVGRNPTGRACRPAPPQVQDVHRPFFCLDLSYAHTLLTKGFKIPDDASITLVKKVSQ